MGYRCWFFEIKIRNELEWWGPDDYGQACFTANELSECTGRIKYDPELAIKVKTNVELGAP
jgi:hypothetical protein